MVVRLRMNLPIIVGQADKGLQLNVQINNAQVQTPITAKTNPCEVAWKDWHQFFLRLQNRKQPFDKNSLKNNVKLTQQTHFKQSSFSTVVNKYYEQIKGCVTCGIDRSQFVFELVLSTFYWRQSECEKCDDPQAAPKLSSNDWDENRNLTSSTKKRKSCRSGSDGAEHDVMESSCHESNNNEDKALEIATWFRRRIKAKCRRK